jgi:hypothetical protein
MHGWLGPRADLDVFPRAGTQRFLITTSQYQQKCNFACFYGRETWSPALREEHGLSMLENRVLNSVFVDKNWEKQNTEELRDKLHDLYSSSANKFGKIKQDRMGSACGTCGEEEKRI